MKASERSGSAGTALGISGKYEVMFNFLEFSKEEIKKPEMYIIKVMNQSRVKIFKTPEIFFIIK